jgi:hypothetical protein
MSKVQHKFSKSLAWNTVESLLYNGIMMVHQWALFEHASLSMLGLIGTFFSCIYLTATAIDLGLEASLAPFFEIWSASKKSFRSFLVSQLLPNYAAGLGLMGVAYAIHKFLGLTFSIFAHLDTLTMFCIALTVFTESTRKTLKTILQIAFQNKAHTILEVGMIVVYICIVWGGYFAGYPLDLPLIFGALCIASAAATGGTILWILKWYRTLPADHQDNMHYSHGRIVKSRFFGYLYRISTTMFSSNFIVPLFAYLFGLECAGILKFVSNITHSVTSIIYKIFGASGNALLAHTRHENKNNQQELFGQLTSKLNQTMYALIVFFIINHRLLLGMNKAPLNYLSIAFFALSFIMQLAESFGLSFEKLFLAYERAEILFAVSASAILSVLTIVFFAPSLEPLTLLFIFTTIRTLDLAVLHLIALFSWKIRAYWHVKIPYFIGSVLASLIFFFVFR